MSVRFKAICLVLLTILPAGARAEWFLFSGTAMTTRIELEFWADDSREAERIKTVVFAEIDRVEQCMTRYREDSELSQVNREAADRPVPVSDELFTVFRQSERVSQLSGGAFDISFGSVGYLYDFRQKRQPSEAALAQGLEYLDYRDILLDDADRTVAYRKRGLRVDMGGIAKGYAVDAGVEVLRKAGIRHGRLSAGGDMRLLGDKRGKPWIVGIRDPRAEAKNAVLLPASDLAISTSGDYERFFIDDAGKRIHHILSPSTGRPAQGIQSVTILGPDALTTDGLSTAVFVLGVERGLALINQLPDVDAIIIDDQRRMFYSDGLMDPAPQGQ